MRQLFIDFDDVIFNTKDFVRDLKKLFFTYGVTETQYTDTYYTCSPSEKGLLRKYDPIRQVDELGSIGVDTIKLKKDINRFIKNINKYVFSDVQKFLSSFPDDELYIVSYGIGDFQTKKIMNSGIKKYFKKIIVTDDFKSVPVKKLLNSKAFFLEDRVEQLDDMKDNLPQVTTVFVKRAKGRYNDKKSDKCDYMVSNLAEAKKIIN